MTLVLVTKISFFFTHQLVVTNTFPIPQWKRDLCPKIVVIDISHTMAEAIRRTVRSFCLLFHHNLILEFVFMLFLDNLWRYRSCRGFFGIVQHNGESISYLFHNELWEEVRVKVNVEVWWYSEMDDLGHVSRKWMKGCRNTSFIMRFLFFSGFQLSLGYIFNINLRIVASVSWYYARVFANITIMWVWTSPYSSMWGCRDSS